jgi:hypothetical protein
VGQIRAEQDGGGDDLQRIQQRTRKSGGREKREMMRFGRNCLLGSRGRSGGSSNKKIYEGPFAATERVADVIGEEWLIER